MALLSLTVRTSPQDSFTVEIEENENVEALTCAIFSLRQDLGEDFRLAHKGRPLTSDSVLSAVGVRNGDVIAVAKRTAAATKSAMSDVCTTASLGPSVVAASDEIEATKLVLAEASDVAMIPAADEARVSGNDSSVAPEAASAAPPLEPLPAPATPSGGEANDLCDSGGGTADPGTGEAEPPKAEEMAKDEDKEEEQEEIDVSAAALRAAAHRLLSGDADAHPASQRALATLLQKTAARMEMLEGVVGELGQALQMVHIVSATGIRGANARSSGTDSAGGIDALAEAMKGGGGGGGEQQSTRSFLMKRGDAETQELHRAAASQRPTGGNSSLGGTLSPSSAPMTKEEMDKARRARLEHLEAQQAKRKREEEDAAARAKAKEAMFEKPFVGAAKPIGKF